MLSPDSAAAKCPAFHLVYFLEPNLELSQMTMPATSIELVHAV